MADKTGLFEKRANWSINNRTGKQNVGLIEKFANWYLFCYYTLKIGQNLHGKCQGIDRPIVLDDVGAVLYIENRADEDFRTKHLTSEDDKYFDDI